MLYVEFNSNVFSFLIFHKINNNKGGIKIKKVWGRGSNANPLKAFTPLPYHKIKGVIITIVFHIKTSPVQVPSQSKSRIGAISNSDIHFPYFNVAITSYCSSGNA